MGIFVDVDGTLLDVLKDVENDVVLVTSVVFLPAVDDERSVVESVLLRSFKVDARGTKDWRCVDLNEVDERDGANDDRPDVLDERVTAADALLWNADVDDSHDLLVDGDFVTGAPLPEVTGAIFS